MLAPGTFGNTLPAFGANDALNLEGFSGGVVILDPLLTPNTLEVTNGTTAEDFTLSDVPAGTLYFAHTDSAGTGTLVETNRRSASSPARASASREAMSRWRLCASAS